MNNTKMKNMAKEEGCELKQLGSTEVFYCPEHTNAMESKENESGDENIDEMVDYQMKKGK